MDASARSCAGLKAHAFPPVDHEPEDLVPSESVPCALQLTPLAEGRKYEAALAWINAGTRLHIVHPLWLADCVRSVISPCARFGERVGSFGGLFRIDRLGGLCVDDPTTGRC
jgi:hypothetical protein